MFKEVLQNTDLATQMANDYFTNICNDASSGKFRNDDTFISSLRGLLYKRIPQEEELNFIVNPGFYFPSYKEENDKAWNLRNALHRVNLDEPYLHCPNTLRIVEYWDFNDINEQDIWGKVFDEVFEDEHPGYKKVPKVTLFYQKALPVHCYINEETKSTILFVAGMDIRCFHMLQCGIFAYLPWYFDKEAGVSDQEMELINACKERTSEPYSKIISEIALEIDFKTSYMKKVLANFETASVRRALEERRTQVQNYITDMNDYQERIRNILYHIDETNTSIYGLESKMSSGETTELLDFFERNKRYVEFETCQNDRLTFIIKGYLEYWDEDFLECAIDNENSYLHCSGKISKEESKMLLKAIFLDKKLRIRMCAAYTLRIPHGVEFIKHYEYPASCKNYIPNPHGDIWSCLGNYEIPISNAMLEGNYIGAIQQCIASSRSVNFKEDVTAKPFMQALYGIDGDSNYNLIGHRECIELPNGEVVDIMKALEFLKGEDDGEDNKVD